MLHILKASKRICKAVKRSLNRCIRRSSPTKCSARGAVIQEFNHNCPPGMTCSAGHPSHQDPQELRRRHREAAVYPQTPPSSATAGLGHSITWPSQSRKSAHSSLLLVTSPHPRRPGMSISSLDGVVLDLRHGDPIELFEGTLIQLALSGENVPPLGVSSLVISNSVDASLGASPSLIRRAPPPIPITVPCSSGLISALSLPSASARRRCRSAIHLSPSPSLARVLDLDSSPNVPVTPKSAPAFFCHLSPLISPSLSVFSASEAVISYASSAVAAEASLKHHGSLTDIQDDDACSTEAVTGCKEDPSFEGEPFNWEVRKEPGEARWKPRASRSPAPSPTPSSPSATDKALPESNAGSTPLDPCFPKLPSISPPRAPRSRDRSSVEGMLPPHILRLILGWLISDSWMNRRVGRQVDTTERSIAGLREFYMLPNATFINLSSDRTPVSRWSKDTDEIDIGFEYISKGSVPDTPPNHGVGTTFDEEVATIGSSPTLTTGNHEEAAPNVHKADGELDLTVKGTWVDHPAAPSPDSTVGESVDESEDEELTWEEVWVSHLHARALADEPYPAWEGVWADHLRILTRRWTKRSAGEEDDADPTWEDVWASHLREIKPKNEGCPAC